MLTSDTITAIMPALIKAQSAFAPAVKAKVNPHFKSKYVPLDAVVDAIAQPLRDNGIAIVQHTDLMDDGRTVLVTRLIHESGEWIGGRYPVHPVKNDPQGEGSALTYARRYALMALAGIAPEDDDGNAAVKAAEKAEPISAQQATTIRDLIAATNSDAAKFCAAFGVDSVDALPAAKYDAAVAALNRKAQQAA